MFVFSNNTLYLDFCFLKIVLLKLPSKKGWFRKFSENSNFTVLFAELTGISRYPILHKFKIGAVNGEDAYFANSRPCQVTSSDIGKSPERGLLSLDLMSKPNLLLFRVCHFLPLCSCCFEWGWVLSHVQAPPHPLTPLPMQPSQGGRGIYNHWNPQNTGCFLV